MLTNFFGKSKPITVLVVFVLFFLLYATTILTGKVEGYYFKNIALFFLLFAVVIFINTKNALSFDNSYVFLIFVLLTGIFPSVIKVNTLFYSNLTVLLFLRKIYSLQSSTQTFKKLFDAGFWLAISFLLEPYALLFGVLIYVSIFLHQYLSLQTIIIPIIGFIAPVFLFFTYCFWFDQTATFLALFNWLNYDTFNLYKNNIFLIPIVLLSLFILWAIIVKTPKALAVKNNFRKTWLLLLINFLCALSLVVLPQTRNGNELLYLFFPTAIIIANLVEVYEKKWVSNAILAILILFSFAMSIL